MEDTIFITNIKYSVDEKALLGFFNRFGKIIDLNLTQDNFNDNAKICYIKFSTPEEAFQAIKQGDKSTFFGDPLRISHKNQVVINFNNGVNRQQSYGRGRGSINLSPIAPKLSDEIVNLKDIIFPLEKKLQAEIIELKNLSNIFVRPIQMTEKSLVDLYAKLASVNNNIDNLDNVKNPEVNGFYLAKWNADDKFYRAKIMKKLPDKKFEVCFVDEGTTGDIVTELKIIPSNLTDIPCQFVACTINCKESPELIDLVLKEGSNSEVNIYVTNNAQVNGKCLVNIFIDDKDIIDLLKSTKNIDIRNDKIPAKGDIKRHGLDQQFSKCQVIEDSDKFNYLTIILDEKIAINPRLDPLTSSPITNDLLVHRDDSGNLHRCIVQSYKFLRDRLHYQVYLVDENRLVDATFDSLHRSAVSDVNFPPLVIRGVVDDEYVSEDLFRNRQTVRLTDYDDKKDLYILKFSTKIKRVTCPLTVGLIKTVVMSHVESSSEFYVQFNDDLSDLETMQAEINDGGFVVEKIRHWSELRVDDAVIGPFEGTLYRAIVRQVDKGNDAAMLFFVDYGNSEWVRVGEIVRSGAPVTGDPWLAHRCKLSVECGPGMEGEVRQALVEYCEAAGGTVHMKITGIEEGGQRLVVSITASNKSTFTDILKSRSLTATSVDDLKETLVRKIANLELRIDKMEKLVFLS